MADEYMMENMMEMPGESPMTEEEIKALEAELEAKREELLAPYKAAAKQRKDSAAIIAEHDNVLAELLFENAMRELEAL